MGQGVAAWESSGAQSLPSSSALLELIYYSPKLLQLTPSTHAPACRIQQVACGNGHFLGLTGRSGVLTQRIFCLNASVFFPFQITET